MFVSNAVLYDEAIHIQEQYRNIFLSLYFSLPPRRPLGFGAWSNHSIRAKFGPALYVIKRFVCWTLYHYIITGT